MAQNNLSTHESEINSLDLHAPTNDLLAPPTEYDSPNSSCDIHGIAQSNIAPSDKKILYEVTVSKWTIGWKTPTLMMGFYCLAIVTAIAHYALFKNLDGTKAESIHQSLVTSISNLLANAFKTFVCGALSVAFAQYLWQILRTCTLQVSQIEMLFGIRSNPFLLSHPSVIRATPVLFMAATLSWLISVAIIYPPGALTVSSAPFTTKREIRVPYFDPSFIGNTSFYDSAAKNLAVTTATYSNYSYSYTRPSVLRFGHSLLISGQLSNYDSPCGPNCSYSTRFEGPIFNCSHWTVANVSRPYGFNNTIAAEGVLLYNGLWDSPLNMFKLTSTFKFNLTQPLGFYAYTINVPGDSLILVQEVSSMECAPARAMYTLNTTYSQGVRTLSYSTEYLDLLSTTLNNDKGRAPYPPSGDCRDYNVTNHYIRKSGCDEFALPAVWPAHCLAWYRNANMMALFDSMLTPLIGNYSAFPYFDASLKVVYTLPNGTTKLLNRATLSAVGPRRTGIAGPNRTIIANTPFNVKHDSFFSESPSFVITPAELNAAIANITISAAAHFDTWHTNTTATVTSWQNTYSLSSPLSLFLPYALSLLLTLVFLLLGANALHLNGVSAPDSSFIQLLSTTTGSGALNRAAAGSCLGGTENVPQNLATMKIRFGELTRMRGLVRRAGFGTESEVEPLTRGAAYGTYAADEVQHGEAMEGDGTGYQSSRFV